MSSASEERPSGVAALALMLLLVFLSLVGFGIVIPLLPFLATAFEAEAWQVTLLFSAYSAGQFLGELVWGRLSDRVGRRPVLLVTMLASACGYVALAYAANVWIAIAIRAAAGFFAGNISAIQGYVVDVSPPDRLAGRLGLVGTAFGVGFVVGPALGGLLARPELGAAGFRPPLLVAAGLSVTAVLGILTLVREQPRRASATPAPNPLAALGEALRHPVLARTFAVIFVGFFAASALWSVLGLWTEVRFAWGPRELGLVMAGTGVASATSQGLVSGALVRWVGAGATIALGLAGCGVLLLGLAVAPWAWLAAVVLTASMMGHAVWQPAASTLVSRSADADRQGAVLGMASASGSLARVLGPMLGGALYSGIAPWAPVVFAGLAMLPAAWLGWRAARAA